MNDKIKRILAIITLIILISLIIATLIVAISGNNDRLLFFLLFLDIVLPIILYVYMHITKIFRK